MLSMGFYFLVLGLSIYQLFYLLPLYYETLKQLTTFDTGMHMLTFALFIAILSPLAGILSDRFGPSRVLATSTFIYLITSYYLIPSLNYYTPAAKAALLTIPLGISLGAFFAPISAMAIGPLKEKTAQGVSLMHYLRFLGGSLGTAIATNTLQMQEAVHYEGIAFMQNHDAVQRFIDNTADVINPLMGTSMAQAHGLLLAGRIQQLQALSLAFQDTFRQTFIFGALGSVFLILLLFTREKKKTREHAGIAGNRGSRTGGRRPPA